jgi:hypothetical protein
VDRELALRIVVERPLPGVAYRVQRGRDALLDPVRQSADALVFDVAVRAEVRADGAPNFLGPFAQGKPDDRFIYVNTGARAGQANSHWTRRAKVRLGGISQELVERALASPGAVLQARMEGIGRDGGPACAGVPLLDGGWTLVRDGDGG